MRNILVKLFTFSVITAMGAFGADESLGTWKLNMGKSKFNPTAPVKSLMTTREAAEGGVKLATTGEQADGTKINSSYTVKYDGNDYPVTGAPWDTISIKQVDSNTFTTVRSSEVDSEAAGHFRHLPPNETRAARGAVAQRRQSSITGP